ncbi:DUF3040 domain-containing protein [Pseudonocardia abyssalis]|uniref:DUF3040 domain-containing protein n=1 Tax=Pseudonocardia abyssalis TaxID=2792008 RepID=A0ABS6UZC6_9PSEU|nr:DUF3040 domain-containing protein [Pseudonocardia abyssalis]MBW0117179.1 DUF3040 domain-containing protein [Pseudonocardia abyssalis]MBW0137596.1 DUF3040 domain-containing protein [Pseudonocardia abyssalis]
MLNDRERQVLARIEHHLAITDPEFIQLFRAATPRRAGVNPSLLLVLGLALMVLGSAVMAVPVAVLGMAVAAGALVVAFQRNGAAGFSPA